MTPSMTIFCVLGLYLALSVAVGWVSSRRSAPNVEDYFVASRGVGPIVLFFTLAATNFSAFFYIGFAGASYQKGFGFYGLMAFGTGLVGASMLLIGLPIYRLGKEHGYLTPPEMIAGQTESRILGWVFALVLLVFTLPYLAVQPHAAGLVLESLSEGAIGRFEGACALTAVMLCYLWMGGMRSSAWTDLFQGIVMIGLIFVALFVILSEMGGPEAVGNTIWRNHPELIARQPQIKVQEWISFTLLWPITVPMFPQIFSRFYIAKSAGDLKTAAWLYPLVIPILFLVPVTLGVVGHLDFPNLAGKEVDSIVPLLLDLHAPMWLAVVILTGAIAAFMSTADSQLLAMSSIVTRDFASAFVKLSPKREFLLGKVLVALLAAISLATIYRPPGLIFDIVKQAFTGLAVLFPTTVAVIFATRVRASACIASIVVGEFLVIWNVVAGLPEAVVGDFHPSTPIIALTVATLVVLHVTMGPRPTSKPND
jgi:solute:Na+ symporter, SSS family